MGAGRQSQHRLGMSTDCDKFVSVVKQQLSVPSRLVRTFDIGGSGVKTALLGTFVLAGAAGVAVVVVVSAPTVPAKSAKASTKADSIRRKVQPLSWACKDLAKLFTGLHQSVTQSPVIMALRIVALVAIACLSGSQGARTSLRVTLQASELSHLQVLIANTTKALKESQAASAAEKKAQATEKKAEAPAVEKKAPEAEKKAQVDKKPKHSFATQVTKERQATIIKQLSAEEEMLDKNLKAIKTEQKEDNSKKRIESEQHLQSMMKGKDAEMLKHFDEFTKHANAKAAVGAQDVLSKLKHMIHFIKKGALSGDQKAANGLDGLLKDMSGMVR